MKIAIFNDDVLGVVIGDRVRIKIDGIGEFTVDVKLAE